MAFTLYKKADYEGYLEKLSSGITSKLLTGKSRVWCELYGTALQIFKEKKNASTLAQQVDMKLVHMVRKDSSDRTGTHFEIVLKNKTHVFCASTADDCSNWIRRLQHAMTLNDEETAPIETGKRETSAGDYDTIVLPEDDQPRPYIKTGNSCALDSGYSEVAFPAMPKTPTAGKLELHYTDGEDENGYATVEVCAGSGSITEPTHSTSDSVVPAADVQNAEEPSSSEENKDYCTVEVRRSRISEHLQLTAQRPETEGSEDSYPYASVNKSKKQNSDDVTDNTCTSGDGESEGSSDEDELLQIIQSQSDLDPIPPFPHPLLPADLAPLEALEDFLSDNRKICRPSFHDKTVAEDPVGDMKRLLEKQHLQ